MAEVDLIMPKMGESIIEATILGWSKKEGDSFELDETILEIATDKVDSEVPAPEAGVITKILFKEGDVVGVGEAIARYSTNANDSAASDVSEKVELNGSNNSSIESNEPALVERSEMKPSIAAEIETVSEPLKSIVNDKNDLSSFYSPLVLSIAKQENLSKHELESIAGSGKSGRVTKRDILAFLNNKTSGSVAEQIGTSPLNISKGNDIVKPKSSESFAPSFKSGQNEEIVEMDRMRKLIADHMVMSKRTSPHVTSFVEADVTNIVKWRNKVKAQFLQQTGEKLTYTPILIEAIVKAIKLYQGVNVSLDGTKIIYKKDINIGMATATPSGNLIVPVIKNADQYSLTGLTKAVNDLAVRARTNKLKPDEIQGGTYTVSNVGTFGNVMGTPIINQPQVAVMALGAIRKKPAVIETPDGDFIGIRNLMFLSHSYDHRIVDGALGGSFVKSVSDHLEAFDLNRSI